MIIPNQKDLETILKKDIDATDKDLRILAGHLPLLYKDGTPEDRSVEAGVDRWGEFSLYTLELGASLLRYAIDSGKQGKLVILVDDDVELPTIEKNGRYVRRDKSWHKKRRQRFFEESTLPDQYLPILSKYALSEDHIVSQKRQKGTAQLISEKKLKTEAIDAEIVASNECSLAYKGLLFNPEYFEPDKHYLVSFIPGQCKGNICQGVLDTDVSLDGSHVFFPHIELMGGLIDMGGGYVKMGEPQPLQEAFSKGLVTYRKNETRS